MATAVLPDQALLQRFVDRRDEGAFTELLRRHGSMVRATCLRYLGNTPEADDAFQAVFLVLVRKADRIFQRDLLGPWLHTVAVRAAQRLLTAKRRRQTRERSVDPLPEPAAPDSHQHPYWLSLLDDAVQSLPPKYRVPLLLCDLEGMSREEAAERLAMPAGTVSSRVARGRRLLRRRLLRRGCALTIAALVAALASEATAAVPPALARATTTAALTGRAPEAAATVADRILRSMFLSKLQRVLALATAICLLVAGCAGAYVVWRRSPADLPAAPLAEKKLTSDRELLQGVWRALSGRLEGKDVDAAGLERIKMGRWVFQEDRLETVIPCDVRLDPDQVPKHIDMTSRKGLIFRGLYQLQGDELRIRLGNADAARPVDLDDDAGMLFVLMRTKE